MVNYLMLDEKIAGAFSGLYQGPIEDAVRSDRFSYGALMDGKPAGLFISTLYSDYAALNWIYVAREYRGQEIGRRMLHGGIRFLKEIFGMDIVTVCLEDEGLKPFFLAGGFAFRENAGFSSFRAKLSDLKPLPRIQIPNGRIFSLSGLEPETFDALSLYFESLRDTEIPISLPIEIDEYLDIPSVCIEDNYIRAALLLKKGPDNAITIAFAYAFLQNGKALAMLIQEAVAAVRQRYGEDVTILTASLGEQTERMMEKMFRNAEKKTIFCGTHLM